MRCHSINSGQVFLWKKDGADWYGINGQDIISKEKERNMYTLERNEFLEKVQKQPFYP